LALATASNSVPSVEGGYPDRVRRAAASGNFKEYFSIQEVPAGQDYSGAVFGEDPFERVSDVGDAIVVRIGSNRTGMLKIERNAYRLDRSGGRQGILFGQGQPRGGPDC
jgi:hypothetical protein